jgi:hypothetical protein
MVHADKMRIFALAILTAMACVACNSSDGGTSSTAAPAPGLSGASSAATTCTDPRPQMCMEIYMPVCGTDKSGAQRTYANSCHACADKDAVSFVNGKCAAS